MNLYPKVRYNILCGLTRSGFWYRDFFRDTIPHFCVSHGLNNLGMIHFVYLFCYWLFASSCTLEAFVCLGNQSYARYRRAFNANASLVDAMAAFLLFSYFNFTSIVFYYLQWINIHILCGKSCSYLWSQADSSSSSRSTSGACSSTNSAQHISWHTRNVWLSFPIWCLFTAQNSIGPLLLSTTWVVSTALGWFYSHFLHSFLPFLVCLCKKKLHEYPQIFNIYCLLAH